MASHGLGDDQAHAYYGSGHSSHSSRRRARRQREEPNRMVENLGGYKMRIPPFMAETIRTSTWIGKRTREIGGAFEVTTWEEMKRIMRQRFVPGHYQRELHSKLRKLTQGSKSVEEYYQEMEVMLCAPMWLKIARPLCLDSLEA
ncbi:unnamed protein product [Microthlaspi erraticum]|uniref:Retrotransposon gag domain-containing protein n=1 Tax=Microthlaspi erraticum TaxID=1685480 RepID=A0A6D2K2E4_9BRAS|nr:unnamed protein product [Microthlaspi erraticum]